MQDNSTILDQEVVLWEENPSHWTRFASYLLATLLIAAFGLGLIIMLIIYLTVRFTKYKLTDQRLIITKGIFTRHIETVELYRIKDIKYDASFWQRMVGIGNIRMISSDRSTDKISLLGFADSMKKFDQIRQGVETCRMKRGVKEFDQNDRIV
jgi:membrane protein YdbS with pleckstrin-like domain